MIGRLLRELAANRAVNPRRLHPGSCQGLVQVMLAQFLALSQGHARAHLLRRTHRADASMSRAGLAREAVLLSGAHLSQVYSGSIRPLTRVQE